MLHSSYHTAYIQQSKYTFYDFFFVDINRSIENLEEQKRLLETRADFTKQEFTAGEVDITEAYDSDEDKKWRGEMSLMCQSAKFF